MDLYHYFVTQKGRNIIKNVHYFPIYERHFSRFVGHPITMFEIGTGQGGSCQMWKYYFGAMARIVTIDIEKVPQFNETQIYVRTGDQSDPVFLNGLIEEFGAPDIVLDDGSHHMDHVNASFDVLFPQMSKKGVYLVEDLNTAYWPSKGGGLRHPASFYERSKALVDEMNAHYTNGAVTPGPYGQDIFGISFYDNIVAIDRTPFLNRDMIRLPVPLK
jgi:cephalosporin hydroxylase